MDKTAVIARILARARRRLALADSRKRMRPATTRIPQLRPFAAKWVGQSLAGMTISSLLHDGESVVFEIDTDREGVYVLLTTDLEAAKREDEAGLQYNLANAHAVVYNEQHVPKRKVDLSPDGAQVYRNVAEFGNKYLRAALRKLGAAVKGLRLEKPEEEG